MEDVLDLYAEPYDPERPVVCFDETSTAVAGRRHTAHLGETGEAQASGLRVPESGNEEPVPDLRAPGGLAPCGGYPTAHHGGLRPSDAVAGGRGLSRCPGGPAGARQLEHTPDGFPLRDLSGG